MTLSLSSIFLHFFAFSCFAQLFASYLFIFDCTYTYILAILFSIPRTLQSGGAKFRRRHVKISADVVSRSTAYLCSCILSGHICAGLSRMLCVGFEIKVWWSGKLPAATYIVCWSQWTFVAKILQNISLGFWPRSFAHFHCFDGNGRTWSSRPWKIVKKPIWQLLTLCTPFCCY